MPLSCTRCFILSCSIPTTALWGRYHSPFYKWGNWGSGRLQNLPQPNWSVVKWGFEIRTSDFQVQTISTILCSLPLKMVTVTGFVQDLATLSHLNFLFIEGFIIFIACFQLSFFFNATQQTQSRAGWRSVFRLINERTKALEVKDLTLKGHMLTMYWKI